MSHSTKRSANNLNVQDLRPSGAAEQAVATRNASPSPSSFLALRLRWTFRFNAASSPCSTKRRRTRATVAVPTCNAPAMASSVRPPASESSSASNSILACVILRAAALPTDTRSPSIARSSVVNVTLYFFTLSKLPL